MNSEQSQLHISQLSNAALCGIVRLKSVATTMINSKIEIIPSQIII